MNNAQTEELDAKRMERALQHPDLVTMASLAPLMVNVGKIMEELCRGVNKHDTENPSTPIPQDLRDAITETTNLLELVAQRIELGARQEDMGVRT